jgi:uncharacterized protein (DUF2164 family)
MEELKLTSEEKAVLGPKLLAYLRDELDVDAGKFEAEFLTDFFVKEAGATLSNQGASRCP